MELFGQRFGRVAQVIRRPIGPQLEPLPPFVLPVSPKSVEPSPTFWGRADLAIRVGGGWSSTQALQAASIGRSLDLRGSSDHRPPIAGSIPPNL